MNIPLPEKCRVRSSTGKLPSGKIACLAACHPFSQQVSSVTFKQYRTRFQIHTCSLLSWMLFCLATTLLSLKPLKSWKRAMAKERRGFPMSPTTPMLSWTLTMLKGVFFFLTRTRVLSDSDAYYIQWFAHAQRESSRRWYLVYRSSRTPYIIRF